MPTKYAALVWDRALYLDTLDTQQIYSFFLRYGERLSRRHLDRAARAPVRSPVPVRGGLRGTGLSGAERVGRLRRIRCGCTRTPTGSGCRGSESSSATT